VAKRSLAPIEKKKTLLEGRKGWGGEKAAEQTGFNVASVAKGLIHKF